MSMNGLWSIKANMNELISFSNINFQKDHTYEDEKTLPRLVVMLISVTNTC